MINKILASSSLVAHHFHLLGGWLVKENPAMRETELQSVFGNFSKMVSLL
jgi:hypothetical protein